MTLQFLVGVGLALLIDYIGVIRSILRTWRHSWVEAAAERGLPVLPEKPLGANVAHGQAISEIINRSNLLHMVEFPLRCFPPIMALKKLLDDGPLGQAFVLNAEIVMGATPAPMCASTAAPSLPSPAARWARMRCAGQPGLMSIRKMDKRW